MYASMCGGPETRVDVKSGSSGSERYIHIYLDDVTVTLPTEVALVLAERLRVVLGGAAAPKSEADLERL